MKALVTTLALATSVAAAATPGTFDPRDPCGARCRVEPSDTLASDELGPGPMIPTHHEETPRK
ncbi:MAG: hypothetical protein FJ148_19000 [Deltaproteobacteria bacterium]|nr:hypothetical protein [Deltaproteobacteria bacterium]